MNTINILNPILTKKPPDPSVYSSRQLAHCRELHAAVSQLPVYRFERLAFTDAANIPPVNAVPETKAPCSLFENCCRFLRALL